MSNYGHYLPLHPNTFETARFIGITPKTEGFGVDETHKTDKNGVPVWVVSALVKMAGGVQEMWDSNSPMPSGLQLGQLAIQYPKEVLKFFAKIPDMGDDWEEDRLARREEYAKAHRLKLDQLESEEWIFLNEAQESLMIELIELTTSFRRILDKLAALTWVSPGHTLRQEYVALNNQSLLPSLSYAKASPMKGFISYKSGESQLFGNVVAGVSAINRCIRDYNSVRSKIYKTTMTHYKKVFPDTTLAGRMRWGETSSLETADGKVYPLEKLSEPITLEEISLDLNISSLQKWRAVK
jgi:hypothetical protein